MNTAGLIESECRAMEKLFFRIAQASGSEMRTRLFKELADHLAACTAMEDRTAKRRTLCSSH
jgi:hypothetical protein